MLAGVYLAKKKDGTVYYRSNITFQNKHISLGSFPTEQLAHQAYEEAGQILNADITPGDYSINTFVLSFDKIISLMNFRDNHIYIKNPIYLHSNYFTYHLSPTEEFKFDIDDLFFYSSHRILRRRGHLYVNDYTFANGDSTDYRYSNIIVLSKYSGVTAVTQNGDIRYRTAIHINGNYNIGTYSTEAKAAVAYNKAVDFAHEYGIAKNFIQNYVVEYSAREYADIYTSIKISGKYLEYLKLRS